MAFVYDAECRAAGIDPEAVSRIARRMERAARDAQKLGLTVFGGSGSGSLRVTSSAIGATIMDGNIVVAHIDGGLWDGGDGACGRGPDGLMRGEG